ncbi:MAG TPA: DUF1801 domain-containing protein [Phnomibacter sp.]|nr:DUF1801 domain-containing protein [Phnomibacter sp.]
MKPAIDAFAYIGPTMDNAVQEYINQFADPVPLLLLRIRDIVLTHAPEATESMAYGMPAYRLNKKPLVYFAAFKAHIGIYALPAAHEAFKEALVGYKQGKGSVQIPLNMPIPFSLIEEMIKFRVQELRNG